MSSPETEKLLLLWNFELVDIYSVAHMLRTVYIWCEPQQVRCSGLGFQTFEAAGILLCSQCSLTLTFVDTCAGGKASSGPVNRGVFCCKVLAFLASKTKTLNCRNQKELQQAQGRS